MKEGDKGKRGKRKGGVDEVGEQRLLGAIGGGGGRGGHKKAATDAYAVLDEAFLVAQKQLKDYRRVSHGDVKYKSAPGAQTSEP